MHIAIVGTRVPTEQQEQFVRLLVRSLKPFRDVVLISGGAQGIDSIAQDEARRCGVPRIILRPWYAQDGLAAPLVRNGWIAWLCQVMCAFPGPTSRGTYDAIAQAEALRRIVAVFGKRRGLVE